MKKYFKDYFAILFFIILAATMIILDSHGRTLIYNCSIPVIVVLWAYPLIIEKWWRRNKKYKIREIQMRDFKPEVFTGLLFMVLFGLTFIWPQLEIFGLWAVCYQVLLYLPKGIRLNNKIVNRKSKDEREQFLLYKADSYTLKVIYAAALIILFMPEIKPGFSLTAWQNWLLIAGLYAFTSGLMSMAFFEQPNNENEIDE